MQCDACLQLASKDIVIYRNPEYIYIIYIYIFIFIYIFIYIYIYDNIYKFFICISNIYKVLHMIFFDPSFENSDYKG